MLMPKKLALIVILGVLIISACALGIYFGIFAKSAEKEIRLLLKTNHGEIEEFIYGSNKIGKILVENKVYGITVFDSSSDGTIYYSTTKPYESILTSKNGVLSKVIGEWTKTAMAIDNVNKKIYVVDRIEGKIYIVDIQGNNITNIMSGLEEPRDIALDPELGVMFILQTSLIQQATMYGSIIKIIRQSHIKSLTLDRENKILYFAHQDGITTYQYQHKKILNVLDIQNVKSLAFSKDYLFYIHETYQPQSVILKAVYTKNGTCDGTFCQSESCYNSVNLEEIKVYKPT